MSLTNCRFYEEKYPEIDSFVMVNVSHFTQYYIGTNQLILGRLSRSVKLVQNLPGAASLTEFKIAEMGAYVKLLEYDNIDGMILLSELSRRRIRSIQKLIRVGRNEVVVVLRVDKEKGESLADSSCHC